MGSLAVFSPKVPALATIPERKVKEALLDIIKACSKDKDKEIGQALCDDCRYRNLAILRYAEANIPVEYWSLSMEENFHGFVGLMRKYKSVVDDIRLAYKSGLNISFAGKHGVGKTLASTCILKYAALKGYNCLYTSLGDIISVLASNNGENKSLVRKELMTVDFLVIDEIDPRYMATEQAADLYGRILEDIIRTRIQNKLPIIMCTNSPDMVKAFNGPLQQSISSLMKLVEEMPVLGVDYRVNKKVTK